MTVVVVESPAKAKTINKYLGKDFKVLASYGHVRDLPAKDGSVRPDADFEMDWEVDGKSAKRLSDIAAALKTDDRLILATDPDREGEAISWHVLEVLRRKGALKGKAVQRVVFNAITNSVLEAMQNPREVDTALVDAYLARRALDYLVGFSLSPVLWRKLPGSRSAGRVQSVALRLICDRELEIEAFRAQEYWTLDGTFVHAAGPGVPGRARVHRGQAARQAGDRRRGDRARHRAGGEGPALQGRLDRVQARQAPPLCAVPHLDAAAGSLAQAGLLAARTMQIAQRLYEGRHRRRDGGPHHLYANRRRGHGARSHRRHPQRHPEEFGEKYVPSVPRLYTTKAKNAQEAHEAIRPTEMSRHPSAVRGAG
jgi:DNA topoisomerase I